MQIPVGHIGQESIIRAYCRWVNSIQEKSHRSHCDYDNIYLICTLIIKMKTCYSNQAQKGGGGGADISH